MYIQDRSSNCDPNDSFYILNDGTTNMYTSNPGIYRYCGAGNNLSFDSAFNSITIGKF